MNISFSQVPAIMNAFQTQRKEDRVWVAFDGKIQQLSAGDLHYFDTGSAALDFIAFNKQHQKEVLRFPIEAVALFIENETRQALSKGEQNPTIKFDADAINTIHEDTIFDWVARELSESMDLFNWNQVFYDPLEANTEAESIEDNIQFNRLETLIESLSQFAQDSEKGKEFISDLTTKHWSGTAMEIQIPAVLGGIYLPTHDQRIISSLNTNFMNMENLKFLQDIIKRTGFGETLYNELEKNIQEKKPEFQLQYASQVGSRAFEAVLDFRKSNTSDMYFFNRYSASLERSNGDKMTQTFLINKGKGIDTRQAIRLLQGRALIAEITNAKGEAYKPWVQLDFTKKDDYGNYHMSKWGEGYGYNLRDAVAKFPIKELDGGEKEAALLSALQKGEVSNVTFDNNGTEEKYMIEANPARKTINVYEEGFKMKKHEELPHANRPQASQQQAAGEKNSTAQKNDSKLLNKNRERQGKGVKVN